MSKFTMAYMLNGKRCEQPIIAHNRIEAYAQATQIADQLATGAYSFALKGQQCA